MNIKLLVVLSLFLPNCLWAQYQIKGIAKDNKGNRIDFAGVILSKGNISISGTITDSAGTFIFTNIGKGDYDLSISYLNTFENKIALKIESDTFVAMTLDSTFKQLDEVVIDGKKPIIERKIDRLVFNVENSIGASSGKH